MNRNGGFTLVELMVTLAIAAIVLTIAVPSFWSIVQNNRASTQANELITALNLARSEAVKRGLPVSICPSSNQTACVASSTNWAVGWIVFVDLNNDGVRQTTEPLVRVWGPLSGGATLTGPANIRYQGTGGLPGTAAPAPFQHRVSGCSGNQGRDITLNLTGRASVTTVPCS
nr:GspH/FimT family pseudopilin [Thioalkalivibrio sulfidiphilus]